VVYQNQGGTWVYLAGEMFGTLSPDARPGDLGPSADVGFLFRTDTSPARTFIWSGAAWIEITPIRYGTHAQRLAAVIAELVAGMLWVETDRGNAIYQNQAGTWLLLTGTMWGTLSPDQRPTDLGVNDAGFTFLATTAPPREFIWSSTVWVEVTSVAGAAGLTHPNVVTKVGAAGQIVEGGITDLGAANSGFLTIAAAGHVGVGNDMTVKPVGDTSIQFAVGGVGFGRVTVAWTAAAGQQVGAYSFANYAIPATDKRVAQMAGIADGAINSGAFSFSTANLGAFSEKLRIGAAGAIAMPLLPNANPGVGTKQLWYDPADGNRVKFAP